MKREEEHERENKRESRDPGAPKLWKDKENKYLEVVESGLEKTNLSHVISIQIFSSRKRFDWYLLYRQGFNIPYSQRQALCYIYANAKPYHLMPRQFH